MAKRIGRAWILGLWVACHLTLIGQEAAEPKKLPDPGIRLTARTTPLPTEVKRQGPAYRFIFLGDVHFDAPPEVYHANFKIADEKQMATRKKEFKRNAEMWKDRLPRLLKAAAGTLTPETAFVIQAGDLVQGDCGSEAVHETMVRDALAVMKKTFGTVPFLTTTGNHDIRGEGAAAAYRRVITAWHSAELKQQISSTNFYFMKDNDLYVFIDFNNLDKAMVREAFATHGDARYKFVFSHGCLMSADVKNYAWRLFSKPESYKEMIPLFMKNEAMVFSGHIHKLAMMDFATDEGRVTELVCNSVWNNPDQKELAIIGDKPEDYGKRMRDTYKVPAGIAFQDAVRGALREYTFASGAGFFTIDVSNEGVKATYYGGDSSTPSREFTLR